MFPQDRVFVLQEHVFELRLEMDFENPSKAEIIVASIMPEINSRHNERSETFVKIKNSFVSIIIKAADRTALKASLNSCLKSVILAKNLLEAK